MRIGAVLGRHRDADAAGDLERHAPHRERRHEDGTRLVRHLARGRHVGDAGNQDGELVAAEPGDSRGVAERAREAGRDQ